MEQYIIEYQWRSNQGDQYKLTYMDNNSFIRVVLNKVKGIVTGEITSTAKELRGNIANGMLH